MDLKPVSFSKYEEMGAYHWVQCDRRAPNYNPPLEARYRVLVSKIGTVNKILDVGCGDGYLLAQVSSLCTNAIGLDSEPSGVSLAAYKLRDFPNCSVTHSSCYDLPFPDRAFDVVLLADVFEHLEDPENCIQEISRVLEPAGRLLLTTPKWRPDRMWDSLHVKEYKPEELLSCLKSYFSKVELRFFWPMSWYNKYDTRVGFKAIRLMARYLPNPYVQEGDEPEKYGQMLAICSEPQTGDIV